MAEVATMARKERRRRRAAAGNAIEKMEGKFIENVEHVPEIQSSDKLFRCDTYILSKSKNDKDITIFADETSECLNLSSVKDSSESSGHTYNIGRKSDQDTYNVLQSKDLSENKPIPAPRRNKSSLTASEKMSLDTDRDIAELELDDLSGRNKSDSDSNIKEIKEIKGPDENIAFATDVSIMIPVPKPRKKTNILNKGDSSRPEIGDPSKVVQEEKTILDEECSKLNDIQQTSSAEQKTELPVVIQPQDYVLKSKHEIHEFIKKQKKLSVGDLLKKKNSSKGKKFKTGKMLSSIVKLEKKKIPKIATILKELKEIEQKEENEETDPERMKEDADLVDFQFDSPRYPESVQNKQIYVQDKNGFCIMNREEVLKSPNSKDKTYEKNRNMANSTVKTAVFFQKYWSRTMMYFHGIIAGFAFGHTAMVTAVVMHLNFNLKEFVDLYSRLSLKIHYVFYMLTTLCIISCFDRIDVGHINRKHWKTVWRIPSMWIILLLYISSFALTFGNQRTQARFDAYSYIKGNETDQKIWSTQVPSEIQASFRAWFHITWARDALLIVAWLIISLTKFSDFLCGHLSNMMKYSDVTVNIKF